MRGMRGMRGMNDMEVATRLQGIPGVRIKWGVSRIQGVIRMRRI